MNPGLSTGAHRDLAQLFAELHGGLKDLGRGCDGLRDFDHDKHLADVAAANEAEGIGRYREKNEGTAQARDRSRN